MSRIALQVGEFARLTGTPLSTVYVALARGDIRGVRLGRRKWLIPVAELERLGLAVPQQGEEMRETCQARP